MRQFEYTTVLLSAYNGEAEATKRLNQLGASGWQLVSISTGVAMKHEMLAWLMRETETKP